MALLMRGPAHGYELKQTLDRELNPFFQVSTAPLYYTLKKLEEEGLVTKWSTVSGRRPTKYIYSLTAKGMDQIRGMLLQNITQLYRPPLNLDISLYFLNHLDPNDVVAMLRRRLRELRKLRFLLVRQKKGLAAVGGKKKEYIITAHNIRISEAEIEFVRDLIEAFSHGGLEKFVIENCEAEG